MHSNKKSHTAYLNAISHNKHGPIIIQGNKKQVWVDKQYPILRTVLVLGLPRKDEHHHTTMAIPRSEKNKENIQPNKVPTDIPQIVFTPPASDKTGQEVVLEITTPTKAFGEMISQIIEIESKHYATSQEDIVLIHKGNNTNMVTLEMYNNLKNTINKMDDEITQFANQYEEEQTSIATETSKIVEVFNAPIASENINDAN